MQTCRVPVYFRLEILSIFNSWVSGQWGVFFTRCLGVYLRVWVCVWVVRGPGPYILHRKWALVQCAVIVLINKWEDESPAVVAVHFDNALLFCFHLYGAASSAALIQTSLSNARSSRERIPLTGRADFGGYHHFSQAYSVLYLFSYSFSFIYWSNLAHKNVDSEVWRSAR